MNLMTIWAINVSVLKLADETERVLYKYGVWPNVGGEQMLGSNAVSVTMSLEGDGMQEFEVENEVCDLLYKVANPDVRSKKEIRELERISKFMDDHVEKIEINGSVVYVNSRVSPNDGKGSRDGDGLPGDDEDGSFRRNEESGINDANQGTDIQTAVGPDPRTIRQEEISTEVSIGLERPDSGNSIDDMTNDADSSVPDGNNKLVTKSAYEIEDGQGECEESEEGGNIGGRENDNFGSDPAIRAKDEGGEFRHESEVKELDDDKSDVAYAGTIEGAEGGTRSRPHLGKNKGAANGQQDGKPCNDDGSMVGINGKLVGLDIIDCDLVGVVKETGYVRKIPIPNNVLARNLSDVSSFGISLNVSAKKKKRLGLDVLEVDEKSLRDTIDRLAKLHDNGTDI